MFFLLIFLFLTLVSQVILKLESQKKSTASNKLYLFNVLFNYKVLLAYFFSFLGIIAWILALTKVSLFHAIMITSSLYVGMLLVDKIVFKERIELFKILGATLIVIGVLLSI